MVYVDDSKMSGPAENLAKGWALIADGVEMGDLEPAGLYLGCKHKIYNAVSPNTGKPVKVMEYDMSEFLEDCVAVYKKLTGVSKLRKASTPFYSDPSPGDHPLPAWKREKVSADDADTSYEGKSLESGASKVLMKVLYAARMARFDLLRAVGGLASMVTKWDHDCDRQLYRLMCYIQSSLDLKMVSWCGDSKQDLGPSVR